VPEQTVVPAPLVAVTVASGSVTTTMPAGLVVSHASQLSVSTVTVTTSDQTQVTTTTVDSLADLAVGDTVAVMGTSGESDSSSITALTIQRGDLTSTRMFGSGGGPAVGGAPTGAPGDAS
jgi:hypothetical protein